MNTTTELDPHLVDLIAAMIDRRPVTVLGDMTNGYGELTKPGGWQTLIREIRRPAQNVHAYGHLEPVVIVEGDPTDPSHPPSLSISIAASKVSTAS